jgi:branched-chain amino acid transport system substrate-binding protein
MQWKTGVGALVFLSAAAFLGAAPVSAETGVTKDEIKIGGVGPLTGPLSNLVSPALNAIEAVFDEANKAGGVNGRKVVYVVEDDECLPSKGVGAVKKLIYEVQPFMIVGGGCSNASLAQKPEIVAAKIPWLIVASTADSLTEPPNPYIFTSMSAAWMEVYGALQHLLDQGKQRIAVVWQGDAWGKARIEPLRQAMKSKGIEPVAVEEVAIEPTDLTPTVLKLQQANADGVVLLLFPKAAVPYLRDAYKFGFQPLTTGGSPLAEIDVIAKGVGTPDAVKNFRAVSPAGFGADDPQVAKWKAIIEKRFPNDRFNVVHMFGVAAAQFTLEALRQAGPEPTREGLVKVMSTLSMQPDTYAGPLKCTPEDHQCHRTLGIFALKDGRVTGIGKTSPVR